MGNGRKRWFGSGDSDTNRMRSPGRTWAFWLLLLIASTAMLLAFRDRLDKAHVALVFLIVVLGGSSAGGRVLGLSLAMLAFLSFNFFFLPPYYTLIIADPLDWLVLVTFLLTGIVAAQLLNRAQERAVIAQQRTGEVERLAALGAETLSAGRAEDALVGIAEVIRSAMGVDCCEILISRGVPPQLDRGAAAGRCGGEISAENDSPSASTSPGSLATWVAVHNAPAAERIDGTQWVGSTDGTTGIMNWRGEAGDIRGLLLPLAVRGRNVGVLRIAHTTSIELDSAQRQFLGALSYYAALGVERVRLVAEAERAEAFRQADALKTALVATVSHDLRTPLTTIKALAHRLAERGIADARSIEEESDRLNSFVADLLDLSRLSAGAMPVRPELNSAGDLIGAMMRRVQGAKGASRLRILRVHEAALLFGRFDFVQSLRVLVNLVENALKHSPAEDAIDISARRDGAHLRFDVSDRGPGVPHGEDALIFEAFYRPAGSAPDAGGAGLGLAIARGLANAQGGSVDYHAREGGGCVFSFAIPAAEAVPLDDEAHQSRGSEMNS